MTPNTPAAPPGGAAGPRAGERFVRQGPPGRWAVYEYVEADYAATGVTPALVASGLSEADALLLVHGGRVVKELELMRTLAREMPPPKLGQIDWPVVADQADAALAAVRPAG